MSYIPPSPIPPPLLDAHYLEGVRCVGPSSTAGIEASVNFRPMRRRDGGLVGGTTDRMQTGGKKMCCVTEPVCECYGFCGLGCETVLVFVRHHDSFTHGLLF